MLKSTLHKERPYDDKAIGDHAANWPRVDAQLRLRGRGFAQFGEALQANEK